MNVNKVILIGRLTRDPDVRTTASGQTVTTVGVATNDFWKDKNGQKQERTEFHNVVLWGRLGEIAGQYLSKGQEAYFEGRIQSRNYTGKDGIEKKFTEIIATNMQLGSRAQGSSYQRPAASAPTHPSSPAPAAMDEQIPTINLDEEQDEVKIEDVPF